MAEQETQEGQEGQEQGQEGNEGGQDTNDKLDSILDILSKSDEDNPDGSKDTDNKGDNEDGNRDTDKNNFTMPEGFAEEDREAFDTFVKAATDKGIAPEQVQTMVDLYGSQLQGLAQSTQDSFEATNDAWMEEVRKDDTVGGAKLQDSIGLMKKGLDAFGDQEAISILKESGLSNRLPIVKMLVKIGQAVSDDSFQFGNDSRGNENKSPAEVMYPNQGKQQ